MYSSESSRRSQSRRRPDLNINTSTSGRDALPMSPPLPVRKPPVPAKGKPPVSSRGLGVQPPSARDNEGSFLDTNSPIDMANKENHPDFRDQPAKKPNRDSHDLTLPARQVTRDSLVTNMLLSLDKFSLGQINTPPTPMSPFDEPDPYVGGEDLSRTMSAISRPGRLNQGHGHGYSYSSDLDGPDDAASRLSSQFSRGRRSNSSSGFQSSLGRINSMRETSSQRANTMTGGRALHSRGGKTSKSSSTNSFDPGYAQVLSSQRWVHGIGARSPSLDYGPQSSQMSSNVNAESNAAGAGGAPWSIEFSSSLSTSFFSTGNEYEAAPMPTIPGGPRRNPMSSATVAPLQPPPMPQEPEEPERRRSMRSRGNNSARAPSQSRYELPPRLPDLDLDAAPAPNVGYEKSKDRAVPAPPTPAPKERPGFFKRMFGGTSSKTTAEPVASPLPPVQASTSLERQQSAKSYQHIANQVKSPSAPPSRDSQHPQQPQPHHVIQKKSSFFRRRKKSIVETPPVPPLAALSPKPVDIAVARSKTADNAQPSPVSSLRQVMIPYLKNSNSATPTGQGPPRIDRETVSPEYDVEDGELEWRRKNRGFSPDYDPAPNATIRTVKSQSALNTRSRDSIIPSMPRSPRIDADLATPRPRLTTTDATFFEDNSDTDGDKPHTHGQQRTSLLELDDFSSLASGFPSPPNNIPGGSSKPSPIIEQELTFLEPSLRESLTPRLPLQSTSPSSEKPERPDSLGLPIQAQQGQSSSRPSTSGNNTSSRSATSLPSVHVDTAEPSPNLSGSPLDEPEITVGAPTADDRQKAQQIYDGSEDFIQKDRAAAWIGEEGLVRQRTLLAYMELYDFTDKSVLTGLRDICGRLVLRAETQQVDRILVAFSNRWCDCNPKHGFKAMDVIHTMCYSIMLLNTDLHLADIEHKMTRSQFIKNTMTTIKQALAESGPQAFERASILPGKNGLLSPTETESSQPTEQEKKNWRSSFIPPRSESRLGDHEEFDGCGPLVKAPFHGTMRAWEAQLELVLKDIYNSIRDERLPLFGGAPEPAQETQSTSGGLSVMNVLKRTPSVLSKAPSESPSLSRGRADGSTRTTGRWSSKSRSRPRIGNAGFSSSRTSFEDGNSIWSPTVSSATWSRYSLGRTQTSMSVDSIGSSYPYGDYQQSIGFANALSQAIIREDGPMDSTRSIISDEFNGASMLEDESLELSGPPWVKEGIVIHKHHLDGVDKKAKDRNWTEVFAVIQKGTMSIFSFSTKSMRQKARVGRKHAPGGVVGGGNWQENATSLGTFSLRQTLASALPSPGYSRTRPHVWALSLPTGAVHLFQVGTPEIIKEFVLTVNYWSARLSTHPLVGGISNVEYGWSDACINNALVSAINDNQIPPRPGSAAAGRTSMHSRNGSRQSSLRSSFDVGSSNTRTKLPGDRIHIADWAPPAQSLRGSNLSESEQLQTLLTYVRGIEDELQQHNQLRSPMLLAFTPRGSNASKAMTNWERKSSYLLREIVKFRTYVDCLHVAEQRRKEIYTEREIARRAARGEEVEADSDEELGDVTLRIGDNGIVEHSPKTQY
ncbi:hypothetical protein BX600DRAFT_510704 [Xylariales sp. PMI_506]|nr:hypothetical protein BX600DRAFT_510704 [Xylariales sp. PMI_506]